jgi:hypothetical protein
MMRWLSPDEAADAIRTGRGKGVRVAILDSGVETDHPMLEGMRLADDVAIVEDGLRLREAPGGVDRFGHGSRRRPRSGVSGSSANRSRPARRRSPKARGSRWSAAITS